MTRLMIIMKPNTQHKIYKWQLSGKQTTMNTNKNLNTPIKSLQQ